MTDTSSQSKKHLVKPLLGWLCFAGLLLLLRGLPFREWLLPNLESLQETGMAGKAIFVAIGILLTSLFLPVSILVFSSGMLFGVPVGFALATVILLSGTSLGFWMGRFLWPRIQDWSMFRNRIFRALHRAIEEEGLWLVTLLRLSPFFHFMTGNLFFGSLKVRFLPYLFFSYLGMIPGTLIVVYAGSIATKTLESEQRLPLWQGLLFAVGVIIFSWVSWRITLSTRKILHAGDGTGDRSTTTAR
jgi:uncharacterized membrane protein YdjX (TVP38/TMEM64 family)